MKTISPQSSSETTGNRGSSAVVANLNSVRHALGGVSSVMRTFAYKGSGNGRHLRCGSDTNPTEGPMDDVNIVKIQQPSRRIVQLSSRLGRGDQRA